MCPDPGVARRRRPDGLLADRTARDRTARDGVAAVLATLAAHVAARVSG